MKKLATIIAFSLTAMGSLSAQDETPEAPQKVKDYFGYVDLGVGPAPVPLPIFGFGHRAQNGTFGFDMNMRVSTFVNLTQVKGNLLFLHYFKPDAAKQFYFGAGPGVSGIFTDFKHLDKTVLTVSPEFVFGKEYKADTGAKRFFQAQISWPTYATDRVQGHKLDSDHLIKYPLVTLHYGWGF